jgi:hypothetical protein
MTVMDAVPLAEPTVAVSVTRPLRFFAPFAVILIPLAPLRLTRLESLTLHVTLTPLTGRSFASNALAVNC